MEMTDKLRQLKLDRAVGVEPTPPPKSPPMRNSTPVPRHRKLATGAVLVGVALVQSFGWHDSARADDPKADDPSVTAVLALLMRHGALTSIHTPRSRSQ